MLSQRAEELADASGQAAKKRDLYSSNQSTHLSQLGVNRKGLEGLILKSGPKETLGATSPRIGAGAQKRRPGRAPQGCGTQLTAFWRLACLASALDAGCTLLRDELCSMLAPRAEELATHSGQAPKKRIYIYIYKVVFQTCLNVHTILSMIGLPLARELGQIQCAIQLPGRPKVALFSWHT